jgi:hypothetical protein
MSDDSQVKEIQERMADCIRQLTRLAPMVGAARQIKEFSSDQRKNALAVEQIKFIQRGESVAAAENLARANPTFLTRFRELEEQYANACATIAEWEAVMARFEACRSMGAMLRETVKTLQG